MIPGLVSVLSLIVDFFYEATPFVILALALALLWQLSKVAISFFFASAKVIAFVALLIALNAALNRKEEFAELRNFDYRGYASKSVAKWGEVIEEASLEKLSSASIWDLEQFRSKDIG